MRTALLLIGLIVSSVSFAGEKQLTCLYIENPYATGLMDKGAWRTDKIVFNTDDFDRLAPLLTLVVELKFHGKDKDKVIEGTRSYDNVAYRVSPTSLVFDYTDEFGMRSTYKVNRTLLTSRTDMRDGECSIGDAEVLRERAF
jgi:hypothetical protein